MAAVALIPRTDRFRCLIGQAVTIQLQEVTGGSSFVKQIVKWFFPSLEAVVLILTVVESFSAISGKAISGKLQQYKMVE